MDVQRAIELYKTMLTAREVDERERVFVAQNLSHFHVSGAGHEALAVLAAYLTPADWLHLHYRDKALLLARGMPAGEFFLSILARAGSHSKGRQMSAHLSSPALNVCSMVGPVGNNALQAVGIAAAIKDNPENPLVVCCLGDGSTQQGEFLEAVAEAVRWQLPVLFIVEDNQYSISTKTAGKTFFDLPQGQADSFYGLPIHRVDGTDALQSDLGLQALVAQVRESRGPALVVFAVERLASHTNADDQSLYRGAQEVADGRSARDPLLKLALWLRSQGVEESALRAWAQEVRAAVEIAAWQAQAGADPEPAMSAKADYPAAFAQRAEYLGDGSTPRLAMREAINGVLRTRLSADAGVFLYGEDIEDPKGDVFGVTGGLSSAFPGRVVNACLSESTIIGTAVGRALAGQRPVAFIQFADFLALGFNQILSELGSMYWRSAGGWQCPVILMVTCGAYKPGLGPFHAQTLEATMAHVPGVDVFMPAFAGDAAGLLNAAFESPRPTVFFYPKICLNHPARTTSADVACQFVQPGRARQLAHGSDLTLVSWGNTVAHCEEVASVLAAHGATVDLFDLRCLSPWDAPAIVASAEKTGRLLVVHEDNHTCGFGAEVLATVAEAAKRPVRMRRLTRPDTFIPYHYGNQLEILPSFKGSLQACADLLGLDLDWILPEAGDPPGQCTITAIGSGPADESVEVVMLSLQPGDAVQAGDVVAEVEATKAVVEIRSTATGTVRAVLAKVGDRVSVNAPLLRLQTDEAVAPPMQVVTQENPGTPRLTRRAAADRSGLAASAGMGAPSSLYLARPACVLGGKAVTSAELAAGIPGWTADEVVKRTGVESRQWVAEGEDVVSLAVRAAEALLSRLDATAPKIVAILCSTGSPRESSPTVACQVATHFQGHERFAKDLPAFDFNAACSGYLYGLRLAAGFLGNGAPGAVLLLTSEVVSPTLDLADPATAFLFGDAASATLVTASPLGAGRALKLQPPVLLSAPDRDQAIWMPLRGAQRPLHMDGIAVARTAYKAMGNAALAALASVGLAATDVTALVAHPGSKRILQNVAAHLEVPLSLVRTTLADTGNTSSSSIPLALERFWDELPGDGHIALAAFGAGFTIAASTAHIVGEPHG